MPLIPDWAVPSQYACGVGVRLLARLGDRLLQKVVRAAVPVLAERRAARTR